MHGLAPPFHAPTVMSLQSLDWREVRLKLLWPVVSFEPHWCGQYLCHQNTNADFHIPLIPVHQTFHPWSSKEVPENVWRNEWSFVLTQPRGVSPVWHWASDEHCALCGTSSVSLPSGVCFSRVVVVHLAHLAHMTAQRGVPSIGVMWKIGFGGGLGRVLSAVSSWGRKGCLQQPGNSLHTVLPPTSPSPSSSPIGASFSQDQVTWFQWNGISFSIIVLLLSLSLWCGLHLSFFEGFLQLFT